MKRAARCWICGQLFEAVRGALRSNARFICTRCEDDGLSSGSTHATLARLLNDRHDVPFVDVRDVVVDEDVLRLVPEDFARHHAVLPLLVKAAKKKGEPAKLILAMCDPGNVFALESIKRSSGLEVRPFVSTWEGIATAIGEQYLRIAAAEAPE